MKWRLSDRFDPVAAPISDRHYSRISRGKPGTPQFVKPGRCLVLLTPDSTARLGALWVTSWPMFVAHDWPDTWECALFRNETPDRHLSSDLVLDAVAATRARYGDPPAGGMITFIDETMIRRKRDAGRCFRRAGFEEVGRTRVRDKLVLRLAADRMPPEEAALGTQATLPLVLPER